MSLLGHVAQNGKNHKTRHEAGQAVYQTCHNGVSAKRERDGRRYIFVSLFVCEQKSGERVRRFFVPVAVIVEGVVARQSKQNAKPRAEGEEDLSCCVYPNLPKKFKYSQYLYTSEFSSFLPVYGYM